SILTDMACPSPIAFAISIPTGPATQAFHLHTGLTRFLIPALLRPLTLHSICLLPMAEMLLRPGWPTPVLVATSVEWRRPIWSWKILPPISLPFLERTRRRPKKWRAIRPWLLLTLSESEFTVRQDIPYAAPPMAASRTCFLMNPADTPDSMLCLVISMSLPRSDQMVH